MVKYYVHLDQPYCERCYKQETCPSCCVCGDIVDGDGVKIGEDDSGQRIYHTDCVRCGVCNDVIHGKIITVDNKFVCSQCAQHVGSSIVRGAAKKIQFLWDLVPNVTYDMSESRI